MKTILFIVGFLFTISLSGCILIDVNHPPKKGGPPAWAPAHGYRKNKVVIYHSAPHVIVKKGKVKR